MMNCVVQCRGETGCGVGAIDLSNLSSGVSVVFFFFQAEDGIRDYKVTGVQTCALPILMEPELEAEMLKVAPAVFFAHAYYGTCISGSKTFKFPNPMPCHRRFGWQCMEIGRASCRERV